MPALNSFATTLGLFVIVALVLHLMVVPVVRELQAARRRKQARGGKPPTLPKPAAFDDEDDWPKRSRAAPPESAERHFRAQEPRS